MTGHARRSLRWLRLLSVGFVVPLLLLLSSVPAYAFNPGNTGQYTRSTPGVTYCNGRLYVGWVGTDGRLNVGWGSRGGSFSNVVTFNDWTYFGSDGHAGEALACFWGSHGTQLYVAWSDPNAALNVGYFDGSSPIIQSQTVVVSGGGVQHSTRTPALAVWGSTMFLGWAGRGNGFPNVIRTTDGTNWWGQSYWPAEIAAGGIGLTMFCGLGGCTIWVGWIGVDPDNSLNVATFNINTYVWQFVETMHQGLWGSAPSCDATLFNDWPSGALGFVYSQALSVGGGRGGNAGNPTEIAVVHSTDGVNNWQFITGPGNSGIGGAAAVDASRQAWIAWMDQSTYLDFGKYPS